MSTADTFLQKPGSLDTYALHRIVEQHQKATQRGPALWRDNGASIRIRDRLMHAPDHGIVPEGTIRVFSLRACVRNPKGHPHTYPHTKDLAQRRRWLARHAQSAGFEIVGVHIQAATLRIRAHDGRDFFIDATDFSGLLRVTDPCAFSRCLYSGIGSSKAFGMGLLVID